MYKTEKKNKKRKQKKNLMTMSMATIMNSKKETKR